MTRDVEPDCWTRVLRRSAGWRMVADKQPVARPAKKWNAGDSVSFWRLGGRSSRQEMDVLDEER